MSGFLLVLIIVAWLLLVVWIAVTPDDTETPASHAVAHAEGWPCSCPGRRQ